MSRDSASGKRRTSTRFRVVVAALLSAGIIILLAQKIGVRLEGIASEWKRADKLVLGLTFIFSLAWHTVLGADKWWRILRALGAKVSWWEVFIVRLGSDPVRFASPFKSGEVVNAGYFYGKKRMSFGRSASSILFDKVLNYSGTWFWLLVGLVLLGSLRWTEQLTLMALVVLGMALIMVSERTRSMLAHSANWVHPKIRRFAEGAFACFREFPWNTKAGFLLYGTIFQLRPLIVCALLFQAFGISPTLHEILTYGSVVVLMSNIPYTTAGIGPREAALVALFAEYGNPITLFSVGILMSFSIHILPAIMGLPFMPPLLRVGLEALARRRDELREPLPSEPVLESKAEVAD